MTEEKSKDPLQGITLERILTELQAQVGWEALAEKVDIRCFKENPSLMSSLKFLRRTPWARSKVERLYIKLICKQRVKTYGKK
ncbi:MAG: VF530 family protein [Desulfoprunum sp.]|nr:VF530 family protein [Desulfoprunum sp.]